MVTWTEKEYAEFILRKKQEFDMRPGAINHVASANVAIPPFKLPANQAGAFALGRLPVGTMNKTEAAYARHLDLKQHAGELLWHKFEAVKLRLADNTFYTPDFAVLPATCVLELHEVKGFWQDDARVKIKVAASIYPFRFIAVKRLKDGWQREEFA